MWMPDANLKKEVLC